MVFTIHRYVFRDLFKAFALGTLILSTVLGLGIMLKPLQQFSVDPANVPTLIFCTLPVTLTMVIPISALLAATLVYGRLASDNEITACRSSGIGLHSLIYPALTMALLVSMATLLLSFHVIPTFTRKFEEIIKTDVKTIIFRNIQKKGNLGNLFGNVRIHADSAFADQQQLVGVSVLGLDGKKIDWMVTARQVDVFFDTREQDSRVSLIFSDAVRIDNKNNMTNVGRLRIGLPIPSLWRDNIKFKKHSELKAIRQDMTLFNPIAEQLRDFQQQFVVERFFQWCNNSLESDKQLKLPLADGSGWIVLRGQSCALDIPTKPADQRSPSENRAAIITGIDSGPIRLEFHRKNKNAAAKLYTAQQAKVGVNIVGSEPTAQINLEEVQWRYAGDDQALSPSLAYCPVSGIAVPPEITAAAEAVGVDQITAAQDWQWAGQINSPTVALLKLWKRLAQECDELTTEIEVELHSRLAFGISCVVLVLLGSVLGIIFRSSHLLTAFGISFIPAALCLITIFTGKHIAEQSSGEPEIGIMFLWSGIAAVTVANVLIYRKLFKQ